MFDDNIIIDTLLHDIEDVFLGMDQDIQELMDSIERVN
jgi:hypothetical protein